MISCTKPCKVGELSHTLVFFSIFIQDKDCTCNFMLPFLFRCLIHNGTLQVIIRKIPSFFYIQSVKFSQIPLFFLQRKSAY